MISNEDLLLILALYHNMKYKIITKDDDIIKPTESTIFCGDEEFLTKVKEIIK